MNNPFTSEQIAAMFFRMRMERYAKQTYLFVCFIYVFVYVMLPLDGYLLKWIPKKLKNDSLCIVIYISTWFVSPTDALFFGILLMLAKGTYLMVIFSRIVYIETPKWIKKYNEERQKQQRKQWIQEASGNEKRRLIQELTESLQQRKFEE